MCEVCPPEARNLESTCCQYEVKLRNRCKDEGVSCVTMLKKMSKIFDKVLIFTQVKNMKTRLMSKVFSLESLSFGDFIVEKQNK